jgi:hypothetical protein
LLWVEAAGPNVKDWPFLLRFFFFFGFGSFAQNLLFASAGSWRGLKDLSEVTVSSGIPTAT